MKPPPRFTREQVTEALRKWIAEQEPGVFTQEAARRAANAILNTPLKGGYDHYDFTTEQQARRILEDMAGSGELLKAGRKEYRPEGFLNTTRQPYYYTPAAWQAAEAEAAARAKTEAAVAARWARIYDELDSRGIQPVTERGRSVRLSTSSWYGLLGLHWD